MWLELCALGDIPGTRLGCFFGSSTDSLQVARPLSKELHVIVAIENARSMYVRMLIVHHEMILLIHSNYAS